MQKRGIITHRYLILSLMVPISGIKYAYHVKHKYVTLFKWDDHYKSRREWGRDYMKEELAKLYQSEEFANATEEGKVEMTTKVLGPLTIPKDVYNELNERYKSSETRVQSLSKEYDEFRKSKMTDDEKLKAEREDFLNSQRELQLKSNRLDVMRKLEKAGLTEDDYLEQLDLIVSEDADKSMKLADFLVNTLNNNSKKVKQQTQVELLNDTPKPVVGNADVVTSSIDVLEDELAQAIKDKDVVSQAKLTRLIQEEKQKQSL